MNKNNTVILEDKDSSNLLEFLRENSPFVSPEEQREFDDLEISKIMDGDFEE